MKTAKKDSLKKRYLYKLATNLVGMVCGIAIYAIIPRGLGPKGYGDFNFLTNFFTQIVGFLDMGTSHCFYTKLSQRPQESFMVQFYFWFAMTISLIILLFVALTQVYSMHWLIWPGQQMFYVYLAALWGILMWFNQVLIMMGDAYGLTVTTEVGRMLQKLLALMLVFILFWFNRLQFTNLFICNYFILVFLIIIIAQVIRKNNKSVTLSRVISKQQIMDYVKEFYTYSHPLLIYALVGLVVNIFDRWMLQYFSGSVEQGLYALSYQIGAFCFLFTNAMTPLLTREYAVAFSNNDISEMRRLFQRYTRMFYSLAAYFSCFIAVQTDKVVYIMGGKKFSGAYLVVVIMAFYPMHQTYGQLSGSIFYASGQTALYRNIGVIFMLIGLPLTYLIIAPTAQHGLNGGAAGLAVKMVLLQFITVNVQLYFNSSFLGFSFVRYVGHQFASVVALLAVSLIVAFGVNKLSPAQNGVIINFIIAGAIYSVLAVLVCYFQPAIFGINRNDINSLIAGAKRRVRFIPSNV